MSADLLDPTFTCLNASAINVANSFFWASVNDIAGGVGVGMVVGVGIVVDGVPVTKASSGSGLGSRYEFDTEERRGSRGSGLLVLAGVQRCLRPDSSLIEYQYLPVTDQVRARGCPSAVYVIYESASWLNRLHSGRAKFCSSVRSMLMAAVRVLVRCSRYVPVSGCLVHQRS